MSREGLALDWIPSQLAVTARALRGEGVLVIHGGLFHRDGVTLAQLNKCNRPDFIAIPPVQARVGREGERQ